MALEIVNYYQRVFATPEGELKPGHEKRRHGDNDAVIGAQAEGRFHESPHCNGVAWSIQGVGERSGFRRVECWETGFGVTHEAMESKANIHTQSKTNTDRSNNHPSSRPLLQITPPTPNKYHRKQHCRLAHQL